MKRGSNSSSQTNFIARNIERAKTYSRNRSQDPAGKKQNVKFEDSSLMNNTQPGRITRTKTPFVKSMPDEQVIQENDVKLVITKGTQTPPIEISEAEVVPPLVEVMAVDLNLTEDVVASETTEIAAPCENSPKVETGSQTETKSETPTTNEIPAPSEDSPKVENVPQTETNSEEHIDFSHEEVVEHVDSNDVQPEQNPTTPIQAVTNEAVLSPSSAKYESILRDITGQEEQFSEEAQREAVEKFLSQPDQGPAEFMSPNKENDTSCDLDKIMAEESHTTKEFNK